MLNTWLTNSVTKNTDMIESKEKGKIMSRKVYVEVKTRLIINIDEGTEVSEVIEEMSYDFDSRTDGADIEDVEIRDFEVKDSK